MMRRTRGPLECADWSEAPPSLMEPLYRTEVDRWATALDWDASQDWREVERGRRLGTVSGLIVTNQIGVVVGWTYYLVHDRALQVGSIVSSSEECTELLLDVMFEDPRLRDVSTVTLFVFTTAPGLGPLARRRGLVVNRYWYLVRALSGGTHAEPPRSARPWMREDAAATVRVAGPDGSSTVVPLERIDGSTFAATLPADQAGTYALGAVVSDGTDTVWSGVGLTTRSYPAEYAPRPVGRDELTRLAEVTGGRVDPGASELFSSLGTKAGERRYDLEYDEQRHDRHR